MMKKTLAILLAMSMVFCSSGFLYAAETDLAADEVVLPEKEPEDNAFIEEAAADDGSVAQAVWTKGTLV